MTRASDACDRLAETRGQLRLAIRDASGPAKPSAATRTTGWLGDLWGRLKSGPGTRTLVQGVDEWAARSPLAAAGRLAVDALDATLRPMARQHPWRLVVGVFVLGGALGWSHPWRRIISPAIMAAVVPQLLAAVVGNVPRPTWITLASTLLSRKRAASAV